MFRGSEREFRFTRVILTTQAKCRWLQLWDSKDTKTASNRNKQKRLTRTTTRSKREEKYGSTFEAYKMEIMYRAILVGSQKKSMNSIQSSLGENDTMQDARCCEYLHSDHRRWDFGMVRENLPPPSPYVLSSLTFGSVEKNNLRHVHSLSTHIFRSTQTIHSPTLDYTLLYLLSDSTLPNSSFI